MDSLTEVEENQADLDRQIIQNSENLLKQQQKLKNMQYM